MSRVCALLIFGLFLLPLPSAAKEPVRVAVLAARTSGAIEAWRLEGLDSLLAWEVGRHGNVRVLRDSELRSVLSYAQRRELLGCSTGGDGCLSGLDDALGADYLLQPEISDFGGTWLLSLVLLDPGSARAVRRVSLAVEGEGGILEEAPGAVASLLDGVEGIGPPAAPSVQGRRWGVNPLLKWSLVGGGLLAAAGGGVLYGGALATWYEYQRAPASVDGAARRTAEVNAPIGVGLLVGGAATLLIGALLPVRPADAVVVVLPRPDGVMVGLAFSLDAPEDDR